MNKRRTEINSSLKQAREARGWTQQQLADKVGVEEQTVRSWEHGKRFPSPTFRDRLSQALDQTPEELGLRRHPISQPLSLSADPFPPQAPSLPGTSETSLQKRHPPSLTGNTNRQKMISRVRSRWIFGILEHSLYQATLMVLGLREQPDALKNPWHLRIQESNLAPRDLPYGTRLLQVYDQAGGELLLLGEPGAGKTTLLLELTQELLSRAEVDVFTPIPVIFNLSSWSERFQPPLEDWIVEELQTKYQVPVAVGREWITTDQLLLLLDGLDEVEEVLRPACIDTINYYHDHHPLVSMVLCSRQAEYLSQTKRIALQQAVVIQPLTPQQIEAYLSNGGHELHALRDLLRQDHVLMELVATPLMLTILILAYHGKPIQELVAVDSPEARQVQVLTTYVQRMLARRGTETRYTPRQTLHWLAWLAQHVEQRSQTEFYLEQLQPDWLERSSHHHYIHLITRLIYGLEIVVCSALFAWLRGGTQGSVFGVGAGLLGHLGAGPGNTILGWMAPGLGGGLGGGGSLGIIISILDPLATLLIGIGKIPTLSLKAFWRGLSTGIRNGLIIGLFFSSFSPFLYHLSHWPGNIILRGLGTGIFSGLLTGLMTGLIAGLRYDQDTSYGVLSQKGTPHFSFQRFLKRFLDGLVFTFCGALGFVVVDFLEVGWKEELLIYGVIIGIFYGLLFSMSGTNDLIHGLGTAIKPAEAVAWSWKNVGRALPETVKKGLMLGFAVMLPVSMIIGAASGLFYGLPYGLHYGGVYGLILGFIIGLAAILAGVLNSGWSSSILDERERFRPNEGIRRSIKNALFAACLFGPLAGVVGGSICFVAFGFVGGLSGWFVLGSGFALVIGIIFALQFLIIHGGSACIEHYILRWYLWRAGHMPWNYVRFLDYAVERILLRKIGGGYIFAHRLLLDYFARWLHQSPDSLVRESERQKGSSASQS